MSLKMPDFNIFVMMGPQKDDDDDEDKEEKKKKKNPLAEALKKSNKNEEEMISQLSGVKEKLKRLPMTSHTGGG